jgi:uncharacterized protein YoxC
MYSYAYAQYFAAKSYNKTKFKEKKVADQTATVVQDVKNLCTSLDTFNQDFGRLNNNVGSSEWSKDAESISTITEDIKSTFEKYCNNIVTHIQAINTSVGQANSRLAGTVASNDSKLQNVLSGIQGISTN